MTTTGPTSRYQASRPDDPGRYGFDVDEGYPGGCYVIVDKRSGDCWFGGRLTKSGLARVRAEVARLNREDADGDRDPSPGQENR